MTCINCKRENKEGLHQCTGCKAYLGTCPHCGDKSAFVRSRVEREKVTDENPFAEAKYNLRAGAEGFRMFGKNLASMFSHLQRGQIGLASDPLLCKLCGECLYICQECFAPMIFTQTTCRACGAKMTMEATGILTAIASKFLGR